MPIRLLTEDVEREKDLEKGVQMETDDFLKVYIPLLRQQFGDRIWFCGLQGSRSRGEAGPYSDVDMVVILDTLTAGDIADYSEMTDKLPEPQYACGFLGGRAEISAWEPSDLLSLCFDTVPIIGTLADVMKLADKKAAARSAWSGACSIYHGCVHNMIYEHEPKILEHLLKNAVFVIKAWVFARSGAYCRTLKELSEKCGQKERQILAFYKEDRNGIRAGFDRVSRILFDWAQTAVQQLGEEQGDD